MRLSIDAMEMRGDDLTPEPRMPPTPGPSKRKKLDTVPLDTVPVQQAGENWNEWLDIRVADALDRFAEAYSEALINIVFTRISEAKRAAEARAKELEATIRELRAEITVLKEIFISKSGGVMRPENTSPRVIDLN
jgi:hypothetical protein